MSVMNPTDPRDALRLRQAIDHTKLTFGADEDEAGAIAQLCREARENNFCAVCVRPRHITLARQCLAGSEVKVATVIGFPDAKINLSEELARPTVGQFSTEHKVAETRQAVADGVDELDLVINVAQLKRDVAEGGHAVADELRAVKAVSADRPIKVIIETDLLSAEEIEQVTRWCAETGMAMVKTSTGMVDGGQGATLENVRRIAWVLNGLSAPLGIKASGGVKTREQALAFLEAGATRIGTSSGVSIVQGTLHDVNGTY